MSPNDWRGVFPALTTKFTPDFGLDFDAMAAHLEFQLDAGVHCRFRNCRHLQEPGCGLQRQWERYPSYVVLMG